MVGHPFRCWIAGCAGERSLLFSCRYVDGTKTIVPEGGHPFQVNFQRRLFTYTTAGLLAGAGATVLRMSTTKVMRGDGVEAGASGSLADG